MTTVPTLLYQGLTEGLVLLACEREPTRAQDLADRLAFLLGEGPDPEGLKACLARLGREDLVEQAGEDAPLALTDQGAARLRAYRELPAPFRARLVHLFDLPAATTAPPQAPRVTLRAPTVEHPPALPARAWVDPLTELLPAAPPIQAPYARVSMDRLPGQRAWVLRVERHDPGAYPGAESCPLTFLYQAATRLLYGSRLPSPQRQGSKRAPAAPVTLR